MKRRTIVVILAVALFSGCAIADDLTAKSTSKMVVEIWDTIWSCNKHLSEFQSLSWQVVASLAPGNYFEVIKASSGRPQIALAQPIRTNSLEEIVAICDQLNNTRCNFLSNARIANALKLARRRIRDICSERGCDKTFIIVLSDGKPDPREARRLVDIAPDFDKHG
jgi:hypothetical protein